MRRRIIAAAIVAAGLTTAGIAYAENQPADPTVAITRAAATGAAAPAAAGGKAGVMKGAIHGDLLVRNQDGSTRTVTFDRGKVSSVSASAITIERPDGVSVTKDVNDQTVFKGTARDQLSAGTPVIVVSEGQAATHVVNKGARAQAKEKRSERREKRSERREKRSERRAEKGAGGAGVAAEDPAVGPSSMVDDGFETIVS
jgi:hypothetical protein